MSNFDADPGLRPINLFNILKRYNLFEFWRKCGVGGNAEGYPQRLVGSAHNGGIYCGEFASGGVNARVVSRSLDAQLFHPITQGAGL